MRPNFRPKPSNYHYIERDIEREDNNERKKQIRTLIVKKLQQSNTLYMKKSRVSERLNRIADWGESTGNIKVLTISLNTGWHEIKNGILEKCL